MIGLLPKSPGGRLRTFVREQEGYVERPLSPFIDFASLKVKRNLTSCVVNRARQIRTEDSIDEKLRSLREEFWKNGCSECFTDKTMGRSEEGDKEVTVQNDPACQFVLKGEIPADVTYRRLPWAVDKTFYAAKLKATRAVTPKGQRPRFYSVIRCILICLFL